LPDPAAASTLYTCAFGLGSQVGVRASAGATAGFRGFTLSLVVSQPATVGGLIGAALDAGVPPDGTGSSLAAMPGPSPIRTGSPGRPRDAWGLSGQYTLVAEHLPLQSRTAANALLPGFSMAAFVIGPLLAGLLVAAVGPALPVPADAASFAILAVAAAAPRGHPRTAAPANAGQADGQQGSRRSPSRVPWREPGSWRAPRLSDATPGHSGMKGSDGTGGRSDRHAGSGSDVSR
jgi:hypothetical protein